MSHQNQPDNTQRERIYICETAKNDDNIQQISIKLGGSVDVIEGVLEEEIRLFASTLKVNQFIIIIIILFAHKTVS